MRVRWRTVLLCLVLGAATTVALAWTLAISRPLPREDSRLLSLDRAGDTWMDFGRMGPGWRTMTLYGMPGVTEEGLALSTPLPAWIDTRCDGLLEQRAITTVGAGWPMIALHARRSGIGHDEPRPGSNAWHTGMGPQWVEWRAWDGALVTPTAETATENASQILPIGVHPLGFVIDVAFWSLLWSLPFVVASLRRAARRRRGQCARCGYDLRGGDSDDCPECGLHRGKSA